MLKLLVNYAFLVVLALPALFLEKDTDDIKLFLVLMAYFTGAAILVGAVLRG